MTKNRHPKPMSFRAHSLLPTLAIAACFLSNAVAAPDTTTPEAQPAETTTPGRRVIDQEELKRLIAEKLAAKADPELIKLLLDQARAGEKRSLDPLADRETFEKLLREMNELKEVTVQVRKDTVGDLIDQSPTEPIEIVVNQTINRLKDRLGGDSRGSLELPKELSRHPVPEFANTPLLLQRVNDFLVSQAALRKTLSDPESEEKAEALNAMILSQESLVWEAAWPFTKEEVETIIDAAGKVPREIYLSRLKRGLERVNAQVTEERTSVGRGAPARKFVLYRPIDEESTRAIASRLEDLRGHGDAWKELAVPFDDEAEKRLALSLSKSD